MATVTLNADKTVKYTLTEAGALNAMLDEFNKEAAAAAEKEAAEKAAEAGK